MAGEDDPIEAFSSTWSGVLPTEFSVHGRVSAHSDLVEQGETDRMELVVPATLRYNIEATAVEDRNQRRRRDDHGRYIKNAPFSARSVHGDSGTYMAIDSRV
jgi:hypothetical protein